MGGGGALRHATCDSLQKTGTGSLVPVFGTGFWCVCHWHNGRSVVYWYELEKIRSTSPIGIGIGIVEFNVPLDTL